MLEFYKSDEAQRAAESSDLWSNVVRPIMTGNTRKFLHEASEEDIGRFDTENRRLKEEALRRTNAESLVRLDRQTTLVHEIRLRGQMAPPSMRAIV